MKKIMTVFLLLFSITILAQSDTTFPKVVYPKQYSEELNAVYTVEGDWEGRLDVYYDLTAKTARPVIFNIHGGGWNKGQKESQTGFGSFFKMGFAVVNIGYRLTQQATAPAAVEDVRRAILWTVKNAKRLNIDPNKIVVMGGSAGGHLALMAGLLQNDNKFDKEYSDVKGYTIRAIINKYGVTDLTVPEFQKWKSAVNWLGQYATDEKFKKSVSPLFYVTKNSPPIFIVHGDADPTVPYAQSVVLHKKLVKEGVKTEFVTVKGGLHGKFEKEKNTEISNAIRQFLTEVGVVEEIKK